LSKSKAIKQRFYLSLSTFYLHQIFYCSFSFIAKEKNLHSQTSNNHINFLPFPCFNRLIITNLGESSPQIPICDKPVNISKEVPVGSSQFMEDPDIKAAEEKIWKSQVIVPCPNSPHAFLGPFPDDNEDQEKLSAVFPSSKKHLPLVFTKGPYDLSFLKSKFRTEPKHENNEKYIS